MVNIELTVNGSSATAKVAEKLTSGMVGVTFSVSYDERWDGLTKKVIFRADQMARVADDGVVPYEVLRVPNKSLFVGVEGRDADGNIVIPTVWCFVGKIFEGASGEIPASKKPVVDGGNSSGGANINDDAVSSSTTWSSEKITSYIDETFLGGAW